MNATYIHRQIESCDSVAHTIYQAFFRCWTETPCLGKKKPLKIAALYPVPTITLGQCEWITFDTASRLIHEFGLGLYELLGEQQILILCSKMRTERFIADLACLLFNLVSAPVSEHIDEDSIIHVLTITQSHCVICTKDVTHKFIKVASQTDLQYIIELDTKRVLKRQSTKGIKVLPFYAIQRLGRNTPSIKFVPAKKEQLVSIVFTSGSTGLPKGVTFNDEQMQAILQRRFHFWEPRIDLSFSFSHRLDNLTALLCGARVGCYRGDFSLLFEDIKAIEPNEINATPRFWNILYDEYCRTMELETHQQIPLLALKAWAFKRLRSYFGSNLKVIVTGGAPISPAVIEFLRDCFKGVQVSDSYGTTESGGALLNNRIESDVKWKLEAWDKFSLSDKPFPRGELLIKSKEMAGGYFNMPVETKQKFDHEGFFHTGDIVEVDISILPPRFTIVGRKKNIFKLAQGEYVAPEKIENVIQQSAFVSQVFIYGDSLQEYVVAVIIPNKDSKNNNHFDLSDITILNDVRLRCQQAQLRPWEIPRDIIIERTQVWTENNGLMTATQKINRNQLISYYKEQIEALYDRLNKKPVVLNAQVSELLNEYIPLGVNSFVEAGGDSLAAVQLINTIRANFDIHLPLEMLYTNSIEQVRQFITVGGNAASHDIDWKQECMLIDNLTSVEKKSITDNIFLTGATGFVGAFLLAHLLIHEQGTIYCLVRHAKGNHQDASLRLRQHLQALQLWEEQFAKRLHVLVGDLEKPYFGLNTTQWHLLAEQVSKIFHCGAWVNHIFPYTVLRDSNVQGTSEIIRLASTTRKKELHYLSTSSIFEQIYTKIVEMERPTSEPLLLNNMNGYNASKCVAETLVWKAADTLEIPVWIYRLGFVGGSCTSGVSNMPAFDSRLVRSIVALGIAPCSDVPGGMEVTPVDWLCHAIYQISQQAPHNQTFHLMDTRSNTSLDIIIQSLIEFGYHHIQRVKHFETWCHHLFRADSTIPLYPIAQTYFDNTDSFPLRTATHYQTTHTDVFLNQLQRPAIDIAYFSQCWHWMAKQGFLPKP
jgi:fatty acid CoA ligase FadD9